MTQDHLAKPKDVPEADHPAKDAILNLGFALQADGYRFVAPTPLTYRRVLGRKRTVSDNIFSSVFGWNRPFHLEELPTRYQELLTAAGLLSLDGNGWFRSSVRFSTIGDLIFAHSPFPTEDMDSVFFGPDTYRFARSIKWLSDCYPDFAPNTIVDVGTGTGAGGIFAASAFPGSHRIILTDINHKALAFAGINAALNKAIVEIKHSDVMAGVESMADLIVSNPPYLVDKGARAYRHGGGDWGCALAMRILEEALGRLTQHGHLLLYTGTPVVQGSDKFLEAAKPVLASRVREFRYEEQDPDVFGEELDNPPYNLADRIATVVLHVTGADIIR